jgi:hypothetical protein
MEVFRRLLADVLRRGYFGKASVGVSIQDGVIQRIYRETEQVNR